MSSPGVVHARPFEPSEWVVQDLLPDEETQTYPIGFEQPVAGEHDGIGLSHDSLGEHPGSPGPSDRAGARQRALEEFCYVSSFDRLTSRKPKAKGPPASVPMRVHLRNVLAVTAALLVGAIIYALVGGGISRMSAEFRARPHNGLATIKATRQQRDPDSSSRAPAAPAPPSLADAGSEPSPSIDSTFSDRLLYSTQSIAFTPLK